MPYRARSFSIHRSRHWPESSGSADHTYRDRTPQGLTFGGIEHVEGPRGDFDLDVGSTCDWYEISPGSSPHSRGELSAMMSSASHSHSQHRRSAYARWGKRALDVTLVMAVSPLAIITGSLTALGVLLKLGRPVFFRQRRPGLHGVPFRMVKFRTMTAEYDSDGELLPDHERLTTAGRWLRATSLDELPSLINVLRGEMSLVGPRPLLMEYLPLYSDEQRKRHDVRPGVTGWAQVHGRNALTWQAKFELDLWYVENMSLALDVKILMSTVLTAICREGISFDGSATMPKFEGNGPDRPDS